jgi:hypothetical protein
MWFLYGNVMLSFSEIYLYTISMSILCCFYFTVVMWTSVKTPEQFNINWAAEHSPFIRTIFGWIKGTLLLNEGFITNSLNVSLHWSFVTLLEIILVICLILFFWSLNGNLFNICYKTVQCTVKLLMLLTESKVQIKEMHFGTLKSFILSNCLSLKYLFNL